MKALSSAKLAVSAKHPRPRMVLTSYLQRSGCALVSTQKAGDNVLKASIVASLVPKAMTTSSVTTTLAFGVVTGFFSVLLFLACATAAVFLSYYSGLCRRSVPQSHDCRAHGRSSMLKRGGASFSHKPRKSMSAKVGIALHAPTELELEQTGLNRLA